MVRVRIDLAYDGTPYAGFARQPDQRTVQGTLEGALRRVCGPHAAVVTSASGDPSTTCAGRTDRGVHALAQVVHVDLDEDASRVARVVAEPAGLARRLDRIVGDAITVWSAQVVDEDFDARFAAIWRRYRYRLLPAPTDPRTRTLAWHVPGEVDLDAMRAALPGVVGEHDFAAFCRRAEGRHTMRRILEADVDPAGAGALGRGELHVVLRGTAFCHQQVRAIVGSLVEVGRHRRPVAWFGEVLAEGDRALAGPVAPAHGLTLEAVGYPDPWPDAPHLPHGPVHGQRAAPAPG